VVADISHVPNGEGWLYLATFLDCCGGRIVGWSMADHLRNELVVDALGREPRARTRCAFRPATRSATGSSPVPL
jgi:transposase InsO family protein